MSKGFSRRLLAKTVAAKLIAEPSRRAHWIQALAAYVAQHNREAEAELIANDIVREVFIQNGELLVTVTSAQKLQDNIRSEVVEALKKDTGAKVVTLAESQDPSLIGGLVAQTPDAILDVSVQTKLKRLAAIE